MKEEIIKAVTDFNDDLTVQLAKEALNTGTSPRNILRWVNHGMNNISNMYDSGECYTADLMMAGYIYRRVLELEEMKMHFGNSTEVKDYKGKVLVCTVPGDLHDIGKDIFISLLSSDNFEVFDLGINVDSAQVVNGILLHKPDILAMSGIITNSIQSMKDNIDMIKQVGFRNELRIIVGGMLMSDELCNFIGADYACKTAELGLVRCNEWIKNKNGL